jgi:hypothetical protein
MRNGCGASSAGFSRQKVKHLTAEKHNGKKGDSNNQGGHSTTVECTPSGSSISFSSSSVKVASTKNSNKTVHAKPHRSVQPKEKTDHDQRSSLNDSVIFKEK